MISFPPCLNCAHYLDRAKCAAYPEGIPESIIRDALPHDEPRGDEVDGLVFTVDPERITQEEARRRIIGEPDWKP